MNIMLMWLLVSMHNNFFSQVQSGVQGHAEIPTAYTQSVENYTQKKNHVVSKHHVIDIHTDEKDEPEKIIRFDLGKPPHDEEIIHFDLGIPCGECE